MEMNKEFELTRQSHTATSVKYNLFKMGLSDEAIHQYILLLQNVGTHTHAEFCDALGIPENTYLKRLGELKDAGLIRVQEHNPALNNVTTQSKTNRLITLNIEGAYKRYMEKRVGRGVGPA